MSLSSTVKSFNDDLSSYTKPINTPDDICQAFESLANGMNPLEMYLYMYNGSFDACEESARLLTWTLHHDSLTPFEWCKQVRWIQDWANCDTYYLKFMAATKHERIFQEIDKSLKERKYCGVALTAYGNLGFSRTKVLENSDKCFSKKNSNDKEMYWDEVDHVFVLLPDNYIVQSYVNQYGIKMEKWDYKQILMKLFNNPSLWSVIFGVDIPDFKNTPKELYVSLF